MAVALLLYPIVMGRFPLTGAGFALAFHQINWHVVAIVAIALGILRVLSQFELFHWLSNFFYWIDVIFKAFR